MGVMKRIASGNELFVVTGIEEVDRALASLEPKMQKKAIRKAMRASGKIIRAEAARNLDKLGGSGGELKKSLKTRASKRSRTQVGIDVHVGADGREEGTPYYAAWVEFGTSPRWTQTGAYRGFIKGSRYKFLRPALYDNSDRIFDIFKKEIKNFIAMERGK